MTDTSAIPLVHAAIIAAWRPFVSEAQACAEADSFIRRTFAPANDNGDQADDYDRMLLRIANAIACAAPETDSVLRVCAQAITLARP
jgi:hypothetical protein